MEIVFQAQMDRAVLALTGQDRYIQKAFQLFSASSKTLSAPMLACREWEGSLGRELSLVSIHLHNYLLVNGCVTAEGWRSPVVTESQEGVESRASTSNSMHTLCIQVSG